MRRMRRLAMDRKWRKIGNEFIAIYQLRFSVCTIYLLRKYCQTVWRSSRRRSRRQTKQRPVNLFLIIKLYLNVVRYTIVCDPSPSSFAYILINDNKNSPLWETLPLSETTHRHHLEMTSSSDQFCLVSILNQISTCIIIVTLWLCSSHHLSSIYLFSWATATTTTLNKPFGCACACLCVYLIWPTTIT